MRCPSIRSVLPVFLLLALAACSTAPTARPDSGPVEGTAALQGKSTPTDASSNDAYPPAGSDPLVETTLTTSTYPAPESSVVSTPESYPAPTNSTTVSFPVPAGFPDPTVYTWQTVVSGLERPVDITGDRMGRLLVVDQLGRIHVLENGVLRVDLYLDITNRVGSKENEQGLLGLALHPKYLENGFFYVNYTDQNENTVIARFTADPATASARSDTERIMLQVDQPYPNHNGGGLAFGPDGYLYIGLGDGGSGGDPEGRGQNLNTGLGKLLRIDVDGGDPYAIPADNPYAQGGGSKEIWASGLRNPWRFSFDSLTGDLYIGDVGQNLWEEIDFLPAGSPGGTNFGWNFREAANIYNTGEPPSGLTLVDPIFQYPHPVGCSVTGGMVYRGQALPDLFGIYLFGDFCTGKIWGLFRSADGLWRNQVLFESGLSPSSFGVDDQNELYLLDHQNGAVLKLVKK